MQARDYSEYTLSAAEGYRLCRQGNQFIDFGYFSNCVRFNAEHKTLDIQVDREKEALWMDELVEEYESAREVRYGEEFLGLDEDAAEEDWKENEEDVARLDKRYRISYFPFEDILKGDQFFEKFDVEPRRVPMNNVLSGTNVSLKYGEGLLDFIYADFDSPAQLALNHLRWWDAVHQGDRGTVLPLPKHATVFEGGHDPIPVHHGVPACFYRRLRPAKSRRALLRISLRAAEGVPGAAGVLL